MWKMRAAIGSEIGKFTETLPGGVRHSIFKAGWDGPLDDTPVYKVPDHAIFAMGDNRDDSLTVVCLKAKVASVSCQQRI